MRLGLKQHVVQRLELIAVLRALRDAEIDRAERQHLALAVEDVDLARQLRRRIEDDRERPDIALIDIAVDRERGRAPLVGDRGLAARIEGHVEPLRRDVAEIGHLFRGEGVEQPLARHDLHHVVARHRDVILAHLAGLEAREHRLVAVVGVDRHLDPGLGGELVDKLLRDVFEPVIDRELALGLRRPRECHDRRGGCRQ